MKPILRRAVAAVAIAGGLLATAQVPALAAPKVVAPSLTITASSKVGPILGYVVVGYNSGVFSKATISGNLTGLTAADKKDVVRLYAQAFSGKVALVATSKALGNATKYSFANLTPTTRTVYQAYLFASAKATKPLAISPLQFVYVLSGGKGTAPAKCPTQAGKTCTETSTVTLFVPPSALKIEMKKTLYPYFALATGTTKPPVPLILNLNGGNAKVSKTAKVAANKYKFTVTFSFTVPNKAYSWNGGACVQDSVNTDGIGLPGKHGCGDPTVDVSKYVG